MVSLVSPRKSREASKLMSQARQRIYELESIKWHGIVVYSEQSKYVSPKDHTRASKLFGKLGRPSNPTVNLLNFNVKVVTLVRPRP